MFKPRSKLHHRTDIVFEENGHRYTVGGREYLSLSRVMALSGIVNFDPRLSGTAAMDRGTVCHEVLELDDKGELDESSVEPSLVGYLKAWRNLREVTGFELLKDWVEEKAADDNLRVACRPDRIFEFRRKIIVLDIKSGTEQAWHSIQTAGQAQCLGIVGARRFSAYVKSDGMWKVIEHKLKSDYKIFVAAATVAWWRVVKGGAR